MTTMIKKLEIKYPNFEWYYQDTKQSFFPFGMNGNPVPKRIGDRTIGVALYHKKSGWRQGMKFSCSEYKNRLKKTIFSRAEEIVNKFNEKYLSNKK